MMLLVDYAREIGVAMGSLHQGRHVGWTTDKEKANALRFSGWEISFAVGRESE